MTIAYVGTANNDWGSVGTSSPQTDSFDIGTRTNGLLVVYLITANSSSGGADDVTWNDVSLTQVESFVEWEPYFYLSMWYLANPTDGNNTLSISWSTGSNLLLAHYSAWFDGVIQSDPLESSNTATGSTDPIINLNPGVDNCLVTGAYASEANQILSEGAGETEIGSGYDDGVRTWSASYDVQTTKESQDLDWTGVDEDWGMVAASFKEAAGAPSGQPMSIRATTVPHMRRWTPTFFWSVLLNILLSRPVIPSKTTR